MPLILAYFRPNDDVGRPPVLARWPSLTDESLKVELDRLDLVNAMLNIVCNDRLHFAPIGPTPHRILDIGAGTGLWCIEMGDLYPSAQIIGVDLSANMPTSTPPNVHFEIDDVEDQWTFSQPFDYIHCRYMMGSIRDWPGLVNQCFR